MMMMMKFSTILFLSITLACSFSASATSTDDLIVQVIVPEAEQLTDTDVAAIEMAQDTMDRKNRSLRSEDRQLYPSWCAMVCRNFPFPYCQIWQRKCYRHRRALAAGVVAEQHVDRQLDSTYELVEVAGSDCDTKKQEILAMLEDAVATESQDIVDASHMTCYEVQEICNILSFDLWDADSNTLSLSGMTNGMQIVNSDFDISIEAITDDCVSSVYFLLEGPDGFMHSRNEQQAPYLLFGDSNGAIHDLSEGLANGQYTLSVVADDNQSTVQTIEFELV